MAYLVFTKYVGPTVHRGSRIRVQYLDPDTGKRVTKFVAYPYEYSGSHAHGAAVEGLGLGEVTTLGSTPDDSQYVFGVKR